MPDFPRTNHPHCPLPILSNIEFTLRENEELKRLQLDRLWSLLTLIIVTKFLISSTFYVHFSRYSLISVKISTVVCVSELCT